MGVGAEMEAVAKKLNAIPIIDGTENGYSDVINEVKNYAAGIDLMRTDTREHLQGHLAARLAEDRSNTDLPGATSASSTTSILA